MADSADAPPDAGPVPNKRKKPDLTHDERRDIVKRLFEQVKPGSHDGSLQRGAIRNLARAIGRDHTTVSRVWARAMENRRAAGEGSAAAAFNASPRRRGRCGANQIYNRDEVREAIRQLPPHQRRSLRSIASAIGIPKATLWRMKQDKADPVVIVIPQHSNAIKELKRELKELEEELAQLSQLDNIQVPHALKLLKQQRTVKQKEILELEQQQDEPTA